ncbi:glycosyltransferase family 4 protein [Shewanella sp. AS16]|uniref:glycosyltransferase family 4 protein n=1 Tax=Shewanella sp. AS16 TaxID=2907625 RepID=UPI001F1632DD|nr:glycosyltransferase family 4 protein [Shewanella sp. AS16]MCE9686739.1 glycosyltransferase family 4 protein [Shewanella sp. AS16]
MYKVLHVVHNYDGYSGASLQAKSLVNYLNMYCVNSFVSTSEGVSKECYFIGSGRFKRAAGFVFCLMKNRPDIIHFHGADFLLLIISKLFKVKVYWKTTLHGSDDFFSLCNTGNKLSKFVKSLLISGININNSLTIQNYNVNKLYLPEERIVTIPNGVNLPSVSLDGFFSLKSKTVIIVAALIPRKKILESILLFKRKFEPDGFTLRVIGPDSASLDGFEPNYVNECKKLKSATISFLGQVSKIALENHYLESMYIILLSNNEGMPNVVLEAMSYGVVPILSDMGGVSAEIVKNGVDGYIVTEPDCLIDFQSYRTQASLTIKKVEKYFSFSVVSKKTFGEYANLMSLKKQ